MSQKQAILTYLKKGNSISPLEALNKFGCFRLGARMHELKKQGYNILSEIVTDITTGKRYAEYWIKNEN